MRWTVPPALIATALALGGCTLEVPEGRDGTTTATSVDIRSRDGTTTATLNGVEFRLPVQPVSVRTTDGATKITAEGLDLTVKEGRLWIRGRDFGEVRRGDEVVLDDKGGVRINGKTRQPHASPPG